MPTSMVPRQRRQRYRADAGRTAPRHCRDPPQPADADCSSGDSGLGQHVPCRFGQHALVGHGDSQHFPSQKGHASYGTAKNSQILVDVFECDASVDHHDLQMVDELAHLFRSTIGAFVLSCDPGFARLFDDLLADEMRALPSSSTVNEPACLAAAFSLNSAKRDSKVFIIRIYPRNIGRFRP